MSGRTIGQLREDAIAIWKAGLDAVRSDQLVRDNVRVEGNQLIIADESIDLSSVGRIVVVGGGKAGTGMAAGLEAALGAELLVEKQVTGWLNVPADCVQDLQCICLHPARPAGVNEPTVEGVEGTREILRLVESLGPEDLCICLISGGGSALLPAPVEGVSLEEKKRLTQILSGAGANITELNTVRKQLSRIKGGGLAAACGAGRLYTLIISDVIGDPLDVIASGPTVENQTTADDAIDVLGRFDPDRKLIADAVYKHLERISDQPQLWNPRGISIQNHVIGNNAVAVDAAGIEAERRGYHHAMHAATQLEGEAEEVGEHLARMSLRMNREPGPDCLITGGEPTVQLAPKEKRGRGGRNQQLVLAAILTLLNSDIEDDSALAELCLLSGGTDGEDGPTDAAGAIFDGKVLKQMREMNLAANTFLERNDAYHFFEPLDGLILTGPTHTNVCDLRVCLVARIETSR